MEEVAIQPIKPKGLGRRSFLRGVGGSTLAGFIRPETPLTSGVVKEEIERKYNVEIKTLKELFNVQGKPHLPMVTQSPDEWDIERLRLLDASLSVLPSHFYAEDRSSKKMRITLGIASTNGLFATAGDGYMHEIELDYKRFTPEDPRPSFIDVVHECTHLLVPETREIEEYTTPDGVKSKRVVFKSPWYDEIESILGEPFSIFAPKMRQEVLSRGYVFVPNKGIIRDQQHPPAETNSEKSKDIFADEFDYGFRKDYPGEFIPVLAQTYAQGKEYLYAMYREYLDGEVVDELYKFAKNNIFRGQEYDSVEVKKLLGFYEE